MKELFQNLWSQKLLLYHNVNNNFGDAPYGNLNITNVSQYSTMSYSCDDYDEFKAPIEVLELVLWLKPQCYFIFNFPTCSSKSVLWKFWGKQENREKKENPAQMALSFPIYSLTLSPG